MQTTVYITLVHVTCCECGTVFGIVERHQAQLRESSATFYCPNGHELVYGESETERLKRDLYRAEADRKYYKTQLTRTKNRIAGGVCPCCNRSFENLRRHMATKHANYQGDVPDTTDELPEMPTSDTPAEEFVSAGEAARRLGINPLTMSNQLAKGTFKGAAFKGHRWAIPVSSLSLYRKWQR
jgi:hypothetical protein